jgi:hypothetical protein
VIGSPFFVRGIVKVRAAKSTFSHVAWYILPRRKPVAMARSSSGSCGAQNELDLIAVRSFVSSSGVKNRTRLLSCFGRRTALAGFVSTFSFSMPNRKATLSKL